jgi:hypothetical protein
MSPETHTGQAPAKAAFCDQKRWVGTSAASTGLTPNSYRRVNYVVD